MRTGFTGGLGNNGPRGPFVLENKRLVGLLLVGLISLAFLPFYGTIDRVSAPTPSVTIAPINSFVGPTATVTPSPVASFSVTPARPVTNYPVSFNASASTDPNGTIVSYAWDWGDGTTDLTTTPMMVHTYGSSATSGVTVALTVTDNWGVASPPFSLTIIINSADLWPIPVFTVSPSQAYVGDTLSFNGTGSQDPDVSGGTDIGGGISQFLWLFGDGAYSNAANITLHSYSSPGLFQITLIVTDNSGSVNSTTRNVNILQHLSLAISSDKTQGTSPLLISLSARASGGQGPYTFSWTFGDGGTAPGQSVVHNYTSPGVYHAQVSVMDSAGHAASSNMTVTVTAPASGVGGINFQTSPVLYALEGIGLAVVGLTVFLVAYTLIRRARRKQPPAWWATEQRNKKTDSVFKTGRTP